MSLQDTAKAVWSETGAKKSNEEVTPAEIDLFAAMLGCGEDQQALTHLAQSICTVVQEQASAQTGQHS